MLRKSVAKGRIVDAVRRLDEIDGALRALRTDRPSLLSGSTLQRIGWVRDELDHLRRRIANEAGLR